ncbi:ATPase [Azomonas macrocytogenes]|uniref:Chromosome segregation ATPase n=1 Tax=Azomonas macrocytogenes TaxID=69962 RepID=A0A839T5A0_AZOMA|nr:ATPase [Azomonas macrocytogenes]MBB3104209.1 chromosome segregation ATPase [Azomonas macrocytogenes]
MRNDSHDDPEDVPSLTVERDEPSLPARSDGISAHALRESVERTERGFGTGLLWLLVLALGAGLGLLGWWSYTQIDLLERQLIATQESFARISEDAAGRLQDISGQLVASESTVTTDSEAIKLLLKQLERQVVDLGRQQQLSESQQQALEDRQNGQARRFDEQNGLLAQLAGDLQGQQEASAKLVERSDVVAAEQARFEAALVEQKTQQASLGKQVESLKQNDPSKDIVRLEQDLLIVRSQLDKLDSRIAPRGNTAEFDAFRSQTKRAITAVQNQIANLQSQIDSR